jgi:hypothetical protein
MPTINKWLYCPRCDREYLLSPTNICKCGAILVTRPHKKSSEDENVVLLDSQLRHTRKIILLSPGTGF